MTELKILKTDIASLYRNSVIAVLIWTAMIAAAFAWNYVHENDEMLFMARKEALTVFNKDMAFRHWGASHGGVYVPVTEKTPPNEYLKNIPERDIATPSGKKLTLMNPSYMVRQIMEEYSEFYDIHGHITSLKFLNPDNAPDDWERRALKSFENGAGEVFEIVPSANGDNLRLMRPLVTKEGCLKCHAHQGYKTGDMRGGVSTTVPMSAYYDLKSHTVRELAVTHCLIWLFGLISFGLVFRRTRIRIIERSRSEAELRKYEHIISATDDQMSFLDRNYVYRAVNNAYLKAHQKTREDIIGHSVSDLLGADVFEGFVKENLDRCLAGETVRYHAWFDYPGPGRRYMDVAYYPFPEPGGSVSGISVCVHDNTELKQKEEELRRHQEQLEELDCLYGLSRLVETADISLSDIFQGIVGLIPPAWQYPDITCARIACDGQEYCTENFQATPWHQRADIMVQGQAVGCLEAGYTEERPVRDEGPFLQQERLLLNAMAGHMSQITERKQAKEALTTERRRLSDILRGTNVGTWEWNVQTGETIFNDRWAEIIGYTLDEISPVSIDTWMGFVHPDDLRVSGELLEKNFNGELDYYEYEARMRHRNGDWVWVLDRGKVSTWTEDGKPLLMSGTHQEINDRKQAEEALRESENNFRTFFNTIDNFLFILDEQGRMLEVNQTAISRLGYTADELKNQPVLSVHPENRRDEAGQIVADMLQGKKESCLIPLITRKGDLIPVETYVNRGVWNGKPAIFGVSKDISALKQSEEKFAAAFHASPALMGMSDLETGEYVQVNQTFLDKLGFTPEQVIGKRAEDILKLDSTFRETILGRLREQDFVQDAEAVLTRQDGTLITVLVSARIIELDNRKYNFTTATDITEIKRTREKLARAKTFLDNVINAMPSPVFVKNEQHQWIILNDAFCNFTEHRREELLGKSDYDFFPEEEADVFWEKDRLVFNTEGTHENEENLTDSEGVTHTILTRKTAMTDETGRRILIGVISDITELRKATEKTEAANQAKSEFLSNMSHELRTPLNGILGYAQILRRDKYLTESQKAGVDVIERSGNHLLNLINEILDLSKIEARKMELHESAFQFSGFLNGIVAMIRIRAQQKGIGFHFEPAPDLPVCVRCDEKRLSQILLNLLSNAVKFTDHGSVTFRVLKHQTSNIQFQVEDTGVGIPESHLEDIFSPFRQVGDHTRKTEGTGLGLSISRRLARMMGGELHVESRPGEGSTFLLGLELPEVSEDTETAKMADEGNIIGYTSPNPGRRAIRILVADDNGDNRAVLVSLLLPLGFETAEAADGREGLDKAAEFDPDLIFMDIVMPIMGGVEAIRRIRNSPTLKHIKIIVVSASKSLSSHQLMTEIGCDDFIQKPVHVPELFDKLAAHLGLEWIYETSERPAETAEKNEALAIPPASEIRLLCEFAADGDIRGIRRQLDEITGADERYAPFAAKLHKLARGFQLKYIREFLKTCEVLKTS